MIQKSRNETSLKDIIDTDDALFHYTKRNTALEMVLSQDCFKLFRLLDTNDPREYKARLSGVSGWGWTDKIESLVPEVVKHYDGLLRNHAYFCSFSENKYNDKELFNHGYQKPRMWAQYGEDHYGVCLVFSKKMLIDAIHDSIEESSFCVFYDSISYKKTDNSSRSQTLSINGDSFKNETPFQIAFEHIKNHYKDLFFKKDPDYKDENEFRAVVCRSKENATELQSIDIPLINCIKGLILGDRFPKVYRPTVEQLCNELGIGYKKLHWEKRRYLLLSKL